MLIRSSPLIEYSSTVLLLCLWLGAITTVFSSLIGLFQQDIKKVIAYSTMSQLARIFNKILIIIYRIQAIYVEFITLWMNNSQVTKAQGAYLMGDTDLGGVRLISDKRFNSHLSQYFNILGFRFSMLEQRKPITISRLVETSEAIRLILILFFSIFIIILISFNDRLVTNVFCATNSLFINFSLSLNVCLGVYIILYIIYLNFAHVQTLYFNILYSIDIVYNQKLALSHRFVKLQRPALYSTSRSGISSKTTDSFFEWLAGLIDGVGNFNLTKKGIVRLTLILNIRDKKVLYDLVHKFGGSIHTIANKNAVKYQISHKKGLIALLEGVNGLIRNPVKLLQMNKICQNYNIELLYPKSLTYNNGWLSGFIDADGSISLNEENGQVLIEITQKNKYLLDPLVNIYGGRIKIISSRTEAFNYIIYRKIELFNLIDTYFTKYPLKTKKLNRINLIKEFYFKWISKKDINQIASTLMVEKFNEWIKFKDKWDKFKVSDTNGETFNLKEFNIGIEPGTITIPSQIKKKITYRSKIL